MVEDQTERSGTGGRLELYIFMDYRHIRRRSGEDNNNNNNIRNWPLPIGAFQDQCKQIVINKHNMVKNPNWREADQLAIYKRRREVELGATENNIS